MSKSELKIDAVLFDAVRIIEITRKTLAVVTGEDGRLLGTLTDGDIRRALLAGYQLNDPIIHGMNPNPTVAQECMSEAYLLDLLKTRNLEALPLVDAQGCFKRVVHINDLGPDEVCGGVENCFAAVIMAGGKGSRLSPLTENQPKPMIEVGGMPLIEHQVRQIAKTGINLVYVSVNYLNHIIEEHLGDGEDVGISIEYLREDKKLGTAGALSLLPDTSGKPIIVINGDVLTTSDYRHLLDFHEENGATLTVGAMDYCVSIPYGVIRTEGSRAVALEEKPSQRFLCNAGIYVLSPEALEFVPHSQSYDMTTLINRCIAEGRKVTVFPIHEYWTDIGTHAELTKARRAIKNF